jgi:transcriptional regulator GlxA family with amidase domain
MTVHRVAVLALDGITPIDLAIPTQIFSARRETPYEMTLCALDAKVGTTAGFALVAGGGLEQVSAADTVIVPGFAPIVRPPEPVLAALAGAHGRGRRVVSICTGAFALAAADLLDGLHATTHWKHIEELERDFPAVTVDRDVLYVDEGDVLTSAGVCCGIDLCLHIVRRDLGAGIANEIARGLVAAPHRDGGQAQYVPAPVAVAGEASLSATRGWALQRLEEPLTLRVLARHAGLSQRTFMRRFAEETGTTPLRWLLNARLSRARELLETTDHPVDRLGAHPCGDHRLSPASAGRRPADGRNPRRPPRRLRHPVVGHTRRRGTPPHRPRPDHSARRARRARRRTDVHEAGRAVREGARVPVATGMSLLHDGYIGIYAISTRMEHRKRGYGRQMMQHIMHHGHEAGAHAANLRSSVMGYSLYSSMGFHLAENWITLSPGSSS